MLFEPGQTYYLQAEVSAGMLASYSSEDGLADAYNTFRVSNLSTADGDLGLLRALLPASTDATTVPEPATLGLLAPGLAGPGASPHRALTSAKGRRGAGGGIRAASAVLQPRTLPCIHRTRP